MKYEQHEKEISDLRDKVCALMISDFKHRDCCRKYGEAGDRVSKVLQEIIKIGHICKHLDARLCTSECFNEQALLASKPLLEFETIKKEVESDNCND